MEMRSGQAFFFFLSLSKAITTPTSTHSVLPPTTPTAATPYQAAAAGIVLFTKLVDERERQSGIYQGSALSSQGWSASISGTVLHRCAYARAGLAYAAFRGRNTQLVKERITQLVRSGEQPDAASFSDGRLGLTLGHSKLRSS
jgi:hypothetical protein